MRSKGEFNGKKINKISIKRTTSLRFVKMRIIYPTTYPEGLFKIKHKYLTCLAQRFRASNPP